MKRLAQSCILALALAGCGQYGLLGDLGIYPTHAEQARRQAAWQEAQTSATERGVEPGTIGVGDTPEYVRLQWGEPNDIQTSVIGNATNEWWRYGVDGWASYVHFVDDRVYAIHQ